MGVTGAGWLALSIGFSPLLSRTQAWPGRKLLPPSPGTDLSLRVAELTATRAAALDAHAVELRVGVQLRPAPTPCRASADPARQAAAPKRRPPCTACSYSKTFFTALAMPWPVEPAAVPGLPLPIEPS